MVKKALRFDINVNDASRWRPVLRRDGTYCSPACGFKCTYAAHNKAVKAASELCEKLNRNRTAVLSKWSPNVWENMGWHYSVQLGAAEVHVSTDSKNGVALYWCSLMVEGAHQFVSDEHCVTAQQAYDQALANMLAEVAALHAAYKLLTMEA